MSALSAEGRYNVPSAVREELNRLFSSGYCSEEGTMKTIADTFYGYDYLIDTHTAVANKVLNDYRASTGDDTTSVVVSTASPFKFCEAVLEALGQPNTGSGVMLIDALAEATGNAIPAPLVTLKTKKPRFDDSVATGGMKAAVMDFIR